MVSCWIQSNANARELMSHRDYGHQVSTKETFLISPACRVWCKTDIESKICTLHLYENYQYPYL